MSDELGLLNFLRTKRTKRELKLCLDILQEFKENESQEDWLSTPFENWVKFEQFEDYLRLLTNTEVDKVQDATAKKFLSEL